MENPNSIDKRTSSYASWKLILKLFGQLEAEFLDSRVKKEDDRL